MQHKNGVLKKKIIECNRKCSIVDERKPHSLHLQPFITADVIKLQLLYMYTDSYTYTIHPSVPGAPNNYAEHFLLCNLVLKRNEA